MQSNRNFSYPITINFSDCDPAGIMFYGRIFYYLHEAYESFLSHNQIWDIVFSDKQLAYPLRHAEADYLKPMKHGELFDIIIVVEFISESSFALNYEVRTRGEESVHSTAKTVHVCIDVIQFKKHGLPEEFRDKLQEYKSS